ncbi:MAG: hypothetical protein ACOCTG_01470 [Bacteroidota bacterium]
MVARGALERHPLEAVERALAGERAASIPLPLSVLSEDIALAHHYRKERIPPKLVVIDQVLKAYA